MKIELPDGRKIAHKNLDTAPVDFITELQRQTGLGMDEIYAKTNDKIEGPVFTAKLTFFLSYRTAGIMVDFEDLGKMSYAELGRAEREPGDPGYEEPKVEGGDADTPPVTSGETPDIDPPSRGAAKQAASTRSSSSSGSRSRSSKTKSASASGA